MNALKSLFETWIKRQFPKADFEIILKWDKDEGYLYDNVNAMWIGFNAHYELTR